MTKDAWIEIRRIALLTTGILVVILGMLLGPLPGPLGLPVAMVGVVLILRSSGWARRAYVRAKRRWPRWFAIPERVLRRRRRVVEQGAEA